jgi:hypothetical protein
MSRKAPSPIALGGTSWQLWPDAALRSAGFPASGLEPFCDAALAQAADRAGVSTADTQGYHEEFAAACTRLTTAVRHAAADPALREAVAWQNPALVGTCLDKATRGEVRNVRGRNHELAVASYVQRYTHKNDTIGFFGPVGWACLDPAGPGFRAAPGPTLLRRRTTYFEVWAIDALADVLAARDDVVPWLVPVLDPSATLSGRVLRLPVRKPMRLAVPDALLLHLCDGARTVREILAAATTPRPSRPTPAFPAEPAAMAALHRLHDLGVIRLDLRGPIHARPEQLLRERLERIGDPAVRAAALEPLTALTAARDAVDIAAGDAEKVVATTEKLGETFRRLTGVADSRNHGRTYAARTLIYQDTVRDVDVHIGGEILDALTAPLELVLNSARWLTGTVAERYHDLLLGHFQRQAPADDGPVRLSRLIMVAAPDLTTTSAKALPAVVADVVIDFQRRWRELLGAWSDGTRHRVDVAAVTPLAARLFPPMPARWTNARQHSPDLMIAANDAAALARGEFELVLGEIHLAMNSLESRLFVEQHDRPEQLLAAAERDAAGRRVYAVQRRSSPFVTSRVSPPTALLSPQFTYWTMGDESVECPVPPLRSADLDVHLDGDRLTVHAGDDRFDLLEMIGEILTATVANAFQPVADTPHRPRITLDRFVLCREAWTVTPQDAAWAFVKDERARYAAARTWIAERGIPDRVFVKVPVESKPSLTDFTSLVLVNLLAKAIRRTHEEAAGTVSFSEMLPGPGQLWLADADGNRYTSEVRMVAVDQWEATDEMG